MLLAEEQIERLRADLDYILARTSCDTILRSRGQVLNALERDPDVFLDLIAAMPEADARWLAVPLDCLKPLILRRASGLSGRSGEVESAALPLE